MSGEEPAIQIKLDGDGVKSFAAAAILQQLGKDGGEAVLNQAIQAILTVPKKANHWGPDPEAPIQTAFNQAVREATFSVAREVVAERPEFRAAIARHVNEVIDLLLNDDETDANDYRVEAFKRSIREALLEAFQARADHPPT